MVITVSILFGRQVEHFLKGTRWAFCEEKGFILRDIETENSFRRAFLNHRFMGYGLSSLPMSYLTM